tara:strand:- start:1000 stop:1245 length:246 start_codon:yes stop_codon:yes gene_type:complete
MTTINDLIQEINVKKWNNTDALGQLRLVRNVLLAETDWMSLPDAPTMSDAWKKYRQQLRDITKTYTSMSDNGFSFPTKPTE